MLKEKIATIVLIAITVLSMVYLKIIPYLNYSIAEGRVVKVVDIQGWGKGISAAKYLIEYKIGGKVYTSTMEAGFTRPTIYKNKKVTVLYNPENYLDIEVYDPTFFLPELLLLLFFCFGLYSIYMEEKKSKDKQSAC